MSFESESNSDRSDAENESDLELANAPGLDFRSAENVDDDARPASLAPGRAWAWTGPARRTVAVGPGETLAVPLRAEAFAPGMHALGEYRVAWECIEEEGEARGERQGVGEGVRGRRFVKTPAGAVHGWS